MWLAGLSTYCFCFYKFQQTVYLILPTWDEGQASFYTPFNVFYYIQLAFVFGAIFILFFDMAYSVDFFLVDWEKEKEVGKF